MTARTAPTERRVDRVVTKVDIGPTPMSDHSALIIPPGDDAYRDFHSGKFGSIPRHTRLPAGA
ncbi:hypothetical protein OG946_24810 [Streptomyces sp. NBC_01808]|uniref:hypothetical protein n=1 Tax=Streptomyces sp. NBC_01808 TaxID=2975947 RepID=UPI002DDBE54A|nr:hypothetical protein [Streptomyces sp. NBC_01808]WSA40304.1 hypothetical protein OG946_24810 [Streptomyces sp. NBC_01808]